MWKSRHEEQGNIVNFQQIENEVELSRGPFDMTVWLNIQIREEAEQILCGKSKAGRQLRPELW